MYIKVNHNMMNGGRAGAMHLPPMQVPLILQWVYVEEPTKMYGKIPLTISS